MSRYQRIPYEKKLRIRKYCINHLQKDAAIKFAVSKHSVGCIVNEPLVKPKLTVRTQRQICKKFGCGRPLSITEMLYGNLCLFHQK